MELRHLRYFIAVAEAGSLTVAAERRLHTAQPSLSRQIRDLEHEVGVPLLTRGAGGIALTAAGQAFIEHARRALAQTEAAVQAARRAARPGMASFALGFLTGLEIDWLPDAIGILKSRMPGIEVTVSSGHSPDLAVRLMRGNLDLAFMRAEANMPDLAYKVVKTEPLLLVLPGDHRLASCAVIAIRDVADEMFMGMSKTAPTLQRVIDDYLKRSGVKTRAPQELDNISMAVSLVASTRGVTLLPAFARHFLPASVVARPLAGETPTIDLVIGFNKANTSPMLKLFLSRIDELIARVADRTFAAEKASGGFPQQ